MGEKGNLADLATGTGSGVVSGSDAGAAMQVGGSDAAASATDPGIAAAAGTAGAVGAVGATAAAKRRADKGQDSAEPSDEA